MFSLTLHAAHARCPSRDRELTPRSVWGGVPAAPRQVTVFPPVSLWEGAKDTAGWKPESASDG